MTAAHLPVLDRYLHWVGAYTPAQKASLYTDEFELRTITVEAVSVTRGTAAGQAGLALSVPNHPVSLSLRQELTL